MLDRVARLDVGPTQYTVAYDHRASGVQAGRSGAHLRTAPGLASLDGDQECTVLGASMAQPRLTARHECIVPLSAEATLLTRCRQGSRPVHGWRLCRRCQDPRVGRSHSEQSRVAVPGRIGGADRPFRWLTALVQHAQLRTDLASLQRLGGEVRRQLAAELCAASFPGRWLVLAYLWALQRAFSGSGGLEQRSCAVTLSGSAAPLGDGHGGSPWPLSMLALLVRPTWHDRQLRVPPTAEEVGQSAGAAAGPH